MTKAEQIKQSLKETNIRRKSQVCKVYTLKIDKSHLSKDKLTYLKRLFLEAKWLYNFQLSDIFGYSYKQKTVQILNKDKVSEDREICNLSSQMRQSLVDRTKQNVLNLSKVKNKDKVGKLKHKSIIYSIPLKQYNRTYSLTSKYLKLQGYKKSFRIIGMNQIPDNAEFANANLCQRNGNYYIRVTTYVPRIEKIPTGKNIGLDFGIKDSVVTSSGDKYTFQLPETKSLKKVSRKLNRCKAGSHNRYKTKVLLNKQYEKIDNKKKDCKDKFISKLVKENDNIFIQDENIAEWKSSGMRGFGRRIQIGISGGIISGLKRHPETLVIHKNFPSTQLCPNCGSLNKHSLEQRVYHCDCGYSRDRDIHAANNILIEGMRKISMERRNTILVEGCMSSPLKPEAYMM